MFGALIVKKHPKTYRSRRRFFQLNTSEGTLIT